MRNSGFQLRDVDM